MSDATNVQTTYDREGDAFDTPMWLFAMANDQDGWYHVNYPAVPDGPHGDDEGRTWVRHHPALPAVAAWLAANPDAVETLRDLAYIVGMAAEVCGWKGAHVPSPLRIAVGERFTDARYRQLRSLVAALTTDGGA